MAWVDQQLTADEIIRYRTKRQKLPKGISILFFCIDPVTTIFHWFEELLERSESDMAVTNKRILATEWNRQLNLPLSAVLGLSLKQNFLMRKSKCGQIEFELSGETETLSVIPNPEMFLSAIQTAIQQLKTAEKRS